MIDRNRFDDGDDGDSGDEVVFAEGLVSLAVSKVENRSVEEEEDDDEVGVNTDFVKNFGINRSNTPILLLLLFSVSLLLVLL